MKRKKEITPIKTYTELEAHEIANELLDWLFASPGNFHIDEYLYVERKIFKNDVDYLRQENPYFDKLIEQAEAIELAKLKKYACGDRLNASIVKQILINKYGWI